MLPRRSYVFGLGAAGVLICAVVAAVLWVNALAATAATSGTLSEAPRYFFGSTPSLDKADFKALSRAYRRMKAGGATWVRFRVSWSAIESKRGKYYWPVANRFFAASACAGLDPVPSFMDSPRWANGTDTGRAPPRSSHYPAWRGFIRAAVARYGVGGRYWKRRHYCANGRTPVPRRPATAWKVWNEPNVSAFWGGRRPSPRGYAKLLAAADRAIDHSINPHAKIVMGGLPNNAVDYLKALYTAMPGLNTHFDIFDLHPYSATAQRVLTRVQKFRSVANNHGARKKPIWISEVGWASCREPGWHYPARCANSKMSADDAGQARKLENLYRGLAGRSARLRVRRVAWYGWHDPKPSPGRCSACYGAGLFHRDGSAKPAWRAYARLAGGRPRLR